MFSKSVYFGCFISLVGNGVPAFALNQIVECNSSILVNPTLLKEHHQFLNLQSEIPRFQFASAAAKLSSVIVNGMEFLSSQDAIEGATDEVLLMNSTVRLRKKNSETNYLLRVSRDGGPDVRPSFTGKIEVLVQSQKVRLPVMPKMKSAGEIPALKLAVFDDCFETTEPRLKAQEEN